MMNVEICAKVLEQLQKIGIILDGSNDVNLNEYIEDSLQYISFVVLLEQCFDITFPDEELLLNSFSSLYGIVTLVESLIENK